MESEEKCDRLADKIRDILGQGITLDDGVIHFIDSTFANPAVSELEAILRDDTNCEKDSLTELLFFPGESMQLQLEQLLEDFQLRREDEDKVRDALCRRPLPVTIRFPEDRGSFNLDLPEAAAPGLISRLRISKHLNRSIREAIDNHVATGERDGCKVKIRNAQFSPGEQAIHFLCDFFEKMAPQSHDFNDCLDFALLFLGELKEDQDIYAALMAKKRFYLRSLQIARQLETQLQKNNLETLLSQGKRVIVVDQAGARKNMLTIDRISRAVFGKTEYFDQLYSGENHLEFHPGQAIEDIISKLS
jgi:hypothetical protein